MCTNYLSRKLWIVVMAVMLSLTTLWAQQKHVVRDAALQKNRFNNITLEMSLKPFKVNDQGYIREVTEEVFTQWAALLRHADTVSVMLWTSDGSEILDYKGTLDQPLEWAK